MRNARASTGKGYFAQFFEVMYLRKGYTKLVGQQYYDYQLYDDKKFSLSQKKEFAGNGICAGFYGTITDRSFTGMAGDKLSSYVLFKGYDLPQAEHYAAVTSKSRYCGSLPLLKTREEVLDFLQTKSTFPIFIKPIRGSSGEGAHVILSYDRENDILNIDNGEAVNATKMIDNILNPRFEGFVFQERLSSHSDMREIIGDSVASIRFVLLYYADGPRLIRAVLKLPQKGSITDNFRTGGTGNLIAALDVDTGVVERVIGGEPDNEIELAIHPESGKQLCGMKVPIWDEACDICKKAAGIFPRVRYQGWDVALTDDGPKLLEMNVGAYVDILQRAYGRGVFDDEFQAFVKEYSKPEYQTRHMFKET